MFKYQCFFLFNIISILVNWHKLHFRNLCLSLFSLKLLRVRYIPTLGLLLRLVSYFFCSDVVHVKYMFCLLVCVLCLCNSLWFLKKSSESRHDWQHFLWNACQIIYSFVVSICSEPNLSLLSLSPTPPPSCRCDHRYCHALICSLAVY